MQRCGQREPGLRRGHPAPREPQCPERTSLSQDRLRGGRSRPPAEGLPTPATRPRALKHPSRPPPTPPTLRDRSAATSASASPGPSEPSRGSTATSSRPWVVLTGLGRVTVHGVGRDVHLLHARMLPAGQGPHGCCARAALGASPRPLHPRPMRWSAARRGRLRLGAAAVAARSPRRAAHHPPPGPAAAPVPRGAAGWAGGAAAASGLVMSAAARARGPRRPRPMAGRGGSGRAAPRQPMGSGTRRSGGRARGADPGLAALRGLKAPRMRCPAEPADPVR